MFAPSHERPLAPFARFSPFVWLPPLLISALSVSGACPDPVAVVKTPRLFVLPRYLPPLPISVLSVSSVVKTLRLFVRPNLSGR